jgi:type III secretion protein C
MNMSDVTKRKLSGTSVSGDRRLARRLVLTLAGLAAFAVPAMASEPVWPQGPYPYAVVNRSLQSVLKDFADNIGVRATVADNLKGNVKGSPTGVNAKDFINQLSKSYGFDWYYDGSVMAFSAAQDEQSSSIALHGVGFEEARKKLQADGVLDSRFVFRAGPSPGTVVVAGPPLYVDTITHELSATPDAAPEADCKFVIHEATSVTSYSGPNCMPQ